jgi:putative hydrolase of the HAD superfamily
MIHVVLFDLGGTLIDTQDALTWSEVASDLGIVVDPDHLSHAYRAAQATCDATGAPEDPSFWRSVLSGASGTEVSEATANAFDARYAAREHRPPLFSDVRNCLESLEASGVSMGVVSNSRSERACRDHLVRLGIERFLPVVVSSGSEGVRKPHPEIFRRAVARIGVPPIETLYVGDLPNTDARGAMTAGLHGIWLNRYGWGFGNDPPEITSLSEVPSWVAQFNRTSREKSSAST